MKTCSCENPGISPKAVDKLFGKAQEINHLYAMVAIDLL